MQAKDVPTLLATLDAIDQILHYTSGIQKVDEFFGNRMVFDATLMNFVLIGEWPEDVLRRNSSIRN